jgi:adenylate cyclase class 2
VQEIEAKILEINREKVESSLIRMGARKVFDGETETFFYDFKDGSIIKSRNVLRLRREGLDVVLTYKNVMPSQGAKIAEEYSVKVSDLAVTQKILASLGLILIESMQKHRASYEIEGAHFDIDQYSAKHSNIPEFLEIEADSVDKIHEYAKALGFKAEQCLAWSTTQVIEHYKKKRRGY